MVVGPPWSFAPKLKATLNILQQEPANDDDFASSVRISKAEMLASWQSPPATAEGELY
jgi:hypothetical protein